MKWQDLDRMMFRAFRFSCSKKKFLFTFPIIAVCAVFINSFRALSLGTNEWVRLSLSFLPIFVVATVFLSLGIVLVRAYYNEIKEKEFSYRELTKNSWELMIGLSYASLPLAMIYGTLWSIIGFFYIIKEIPVLGFVVNMFLSFVPFFLVVSFIILILAYVLGIFVLSPLVALKSDCSLTMIKLRLLDLKERLLSNLSLLFVSLIPVAFVLGMLLLACSISSDQKNDPNWIVFFTNSFLTSLVFSALFTPIVVFFYNFSAESLVFLRKESRSA